MPDPFRVRLRELDEAARANAGGEFVHLPMGFTHYQVGGPAGGPPVALVPGFSVPYFIFDPTFEALTQAGFRVLRYDLFGRGWSDRPAAKYDIGLFTDQLTGLLDILGIRDKVSLIGLSMGAPISASFAAAHPGRVNKLVLIDPAGVHPVGLSFPLRMVTLPGLGELVFALAGTNLLLDVMAADFFDPVLVDKFKSRYQPQTEYRGFVRALLSTVRNSMLDSFVETYQEVGRLGTPTLLLWGRNDRTVPFEYNPEIRSAIPQADFHPIDGCGHIPHYEQPSTVNPLLIEFLKG